MQISDAMRIAGHIDEQIAEQAIDEPQRRRLRPGAGRHGQRDLELIELIVPGLVDARRLARRADEQPREEIGKRWMALPIEDEALEQIRPPQNRRIGGRGAAQHDMIAATGAGMASVGHEFVGAEPDLTGVLVEAPAWSRRRPPARGGMNVDLDDARIRRDLDDVDAWIERRRIAFDMHLACPPPRRSASTAARSSR